MYLHVHTIMQAFETIYVSSSFSVFVNVYAKNKARSYPQMHASAGTEISADACICGVDLIRRCSWNILIVTQASDDK